MLRRDILGHDGIQQRFSMLFQEYKLPHAWMLYGMQGVGKAILAKQLAKIYLCENSMGTGQACEQCHACQMVKADTHPDSEYVGLSWNEKKKQFRRDISVDQIRQGLEFLSLTGMKSQRRVLILDDANRMNLAASNALLKGLEEPSSGALLLMVCHDLSGLPETIRSRCLLEHCSPLEKEDVHTVLQQMALPPDVLSLAKSLARGCPGSVQLLQDEPIATACLQWQNMTQTLQTADVANIEAWLQKKVKLVPHDLLLSILIEPLQKYMEEAKHNYETSTALYIVIQQLLIWQHDVRVHTLRPIPSLLARILQARKVLKRQVER